LIQYRPIDYELIETSIKGSELEKHFKEMLKKNGIITNIIRDMYNMDKFVPCLDIGMELTRIDNKHKICMIKIKNIDKLNGTFLRYLLTKYAEYIYDIELESDTFENFTMYLYIKKLTCHNRPFMFRNKIMDNKTIKKAKKVL
jgi:hypothetical protein